MTSAMGEFGNGGIACIGRLCNELLISQVDNVKDK